MSGQAAQQRVKKIGGGKVRVCLSGDDACSGVLPCAACWVEQQAAVTPAVLRLLDLTKDREKAHHFGQVFAAAFVEGRGKMQRNLEQLVPEFGEMIQEIRRFAAEAEAQGGPPAVVPALAKDPAAAERAPAGQAAKGKPVRGEVSRIVRQKAAAEAAGTSGGIVRTNPAPDSANGVNGVDSAQGGAEDEGDDGAPPKNGAGEEAST